MRIHSSRRDSPRRRIPSAFLCAFVAVAVSLPPACAGASAATTIAPPTRAAFHDAMRKLWEDHVTWTRLYIISAAADLPDKDATTQRLLQNQTDIGNAVAGFYGKPAGDALTALLKSHILLAADLVTASKAGDQAKAADASRRWYANADSIAVFLHNANPQHWPLAELQSAMKVHLDQTAAEATHRLHGQYALDAQDYDQVVTHILAMADILSDGIEAQFPQKFAGR
jgi:hypothetical protein